MALFVDGKVHCSQSSFMIMGDLGNGNDNESLKSHEDKNRKFAVKLISNILNTSSWTEELLKCRKSCLGRFQQTAKLQSIFIFGKY